MQYLRQTSTTTTPRCSAPDRRFRAPVSRTFRSDFNILQVNMTAKQQGRLPDRTARRAPLRSRSQPRPGVPSRSLRGSAGRSWWCPHLYVDSGEDRQTKAQKPKPEHGQIMTVQKKKSCKSYSAMILTVIVRSCLAVSLRKRRRLSAWNQALRLTSESLHVELEVSLGEVGRVPQLADGRVHRNIHRRAPAQPCAPTPPNTLEFACITTCNDYAHAGVHQTVLNLELDAGTGERERER